TPVRLVLGFGLVMVNASDVVPPSRTLAAPKALVMVGLLGGGTGMSARAARAPDIPPGPDSVQVIVVEPAAPGLVLPPPEKRTPSGTLHCGVWPAAGAPAGPCPWPATASMSTSPAALVTVVEIITIRGPPARAWLLARMGVVWSTPAKDTEPPTIPA